MSNESAAVRFVRGGLKIGDTEVPLYVASVHYWRLEPAHWRACLTAVKSLGMRFVDTYIPWAVHETAPGVLELGQTDPQRDVAAFIHIAGELGLYVIARPGPHINAELTCFGIPERVVWDPACQARSPEQNPVILPMLPTGFPVPSYASQVFHDETARYFAELGKVLAPLIHPAGPVVLLQVDNEGALYFRDGVYDQDYHPDAIDAYRAFLRDKYGTTEALAAAYGDASSPGLFTEIEPPKRFDAKTVGELTRHIDWAEFQERGLANAMERFSEALDRAGIKGVPRMHNFPPGQDATPLNAARVTTSRGVDLVGYDYYNDASETSRAVIARRTTELAVRCAAREQPAYACEMGAGFPPFFPPLDERDSAFTVMSGLAYGLRGFNVYMAVERDRWIGAPIDREGRERPFAVFWRKLVGALERVDFANLTRDTPVRILTPRNERRLARAMHAFGPMSAAFFAVMNRGPRDTSFEDDLGLGYPPAVEADTFSRAIERALEDRGVPYAHIGGEDREISLDGAKWIVTVSSGGLSRSLFTYLEDAAKLGTSVSFGPRRPELGGARRVLAEQFDLDRLRPRGREGSEIRVLVENDPARIDEAVSAAIRELGLPTYACEPDGVFVTLHRDTAGTAKVLFVLHTGETDTVAQISIGEGIHEAQDLMKDQSFKLRSGTLEIPLKPGTVRMLALS
ncbi:MAG: beta-galactosidase [Polyangiaceae bacterium]